MKLLLIEDEPDLLALYLEEFSGKAETVNLVAKDPASVWGEVCQKLGTVDCVILDAIQHPFSYKKVLALAESLRKPVVIVSGHFEEELEIASNPSLFRFIQKPFQLSVLRAHVEDLTRASVRLSS